MESSAAATRLTGRWWLWVGLGGLLALGLTALLLVVGDGGEEQPSLPTTSDSESAQATPPPPRTEVDLQLSRVRLVETTDDAVWVAESRLLDGGEEFGEVSRLDPESGDVVDAAAVPLSAESMAVAADSVWVAGVDPGRGYLMARVDLDTMEVELFDTHFDLGLERDVVIDRLAADESGLWGLGPAGAGAQLVRFDPATGEVLYDIPLPVGTTAGGVATDDDRVWVSVSVTSGEDSGGDSTSRGLLLEVEAASGAIRNEIEIDRIGWSAGDHLYGHGGLYLGSVEAESDVVWVAQEHPGERTEMDVPPGSVIAVAVDPSAGAVVDRLFVATSEPQMGEILGPFIAADGSDLWTSAWWQEQVLHVSPGDPAPWAVPLPQTEVGGFAFFPDDVAVGHGRLWAVRNGNLLDVALAEAVPSVDEALEASPQPGGSTVEAIMAELGTTDLSCERSGPVAPGEVLACRTSGMTPEGVQAQPGGVVIVVLPGGGWAAAIGSDVPGSADELSRWHAFMGPGKNCTDLLAQPWIPPSESLRYFYSLVYFHLEGMTPLMDIEGNGIPCETVFAESVIADVLGGGWVQ